MRGALSSAVLLLRVACRRSVFALNLTDSCLSTRVTAGKPPPRKHSRDSSERCSRAVSPKVQDVVARGQPLAYLWGGGQRACYRGAGEGRGKRAGRAWG